MGGTSTQAGIAQTNPVAQNRIWEEHVHKENRSHTLNTNFNITSPTKLIILSEKPNRTIPTSNPGPEVVQAAMTTLHNMSSIKDSDKTPGERFALPLTGNMEYGFFGGKPLVKPNQAWDYKIRTCDVTEYATSFVLNKGTSPYVKQD